MSETTHLQAFFATHNPPCRCSEQDMTCTGCWMNLNQTWASGPPGITYAKSGRNWGTTRATLTARRTETATSPAKLTDEYGMQLRGSPGGATSRIRRLNIRGLRTHNAAGHYPGTGLAGRGAIRAVEHRQGRRRSASGRWGGKRGLRRAAGRRGKGLRELDGEPRRAGLPGL